MKWKEFLTDKTNIILYGFTILLLLFPTYQKTEFYISDEVYDETKDLSEYSFDDYGYKWDYPVVRPIFLYGNFEWWYTENDTEIDAISYILTTRIQTVVPYNNFKDFLYTYGFFRYDYFIFLFIIFCSVLSINFIFWKKKLNQRLKEELIKSGEVQIGMTLDEVIESKGSPDKRESIQKKNKTIDKFIYEIGDNNEELIINFKNGKVISFINKE